MTTPTEEQEPGPSFRALFRDGVVTARFRDGLITDHFPPEGQDQENQP